MKENEFTLQFVTYCYFLSHWQGWGQKNNNVGIPDKVIYNEKV